MRESTLPPPTTRERALVTSLVRGGRPLVFASDRAEFRPGSQFARAIWRGIVRRRALSTYVFCVFCTFPVFRPTYPFFKNTLLLLFIVTIGRTGRYIGGTLRTYRTNRTHLCRLWIALRGFMMLRDGTWLLDDLWR